MTPHGKTIELSLTIDSESCSAKTSQLLADHSGLSQAQIKSAMQKGAVWLIRGKRKQRLRRASKALQIGDTLQLNYNEDILNQPVPEPLLVEDAGEYSIWFKPFGLACQGSRWGDFASIQRWVEIHLHQTEKPRPVFLVHRLDRATTGLILLAHSKNAARRFSEKFANGEMDKRYQAIVHGDFSHQPENLRVEHRVDDKYACSVFNCAASNGQKSLIDVKLLTGRKHQIRKHLSVLGYPIIGDRLYGRGAEDHADLQLQAVSLTFKCPFSGQPKTFHSPQQFNLHLPS
jgi:tRNA pseudouridine32 synthase/23S rRNA pseudouridine746 synthase